MPRRCTVCTHPKAKEINTLLLQPDRPSYRDIASQYGVSSRAVYEHRCEHIPEKMAKSMDAQAMLESDDLLGQARLLQSRALVGLAAAEARGTLADRARFLHQAREGVRLLGEVLGKLRPSGAAQVTVNNQVPPAQITIYALPDNGRSQQLDRLLEIEEPARTRARNGRGNGRRR